MTDADRLEQSIRDATFAIAADWADSLHGRRQTAGVGFTTGTKSPPPPVPLATLDDRAQACDRLAGWVMVIADDRDLHTGLDRGDAVGMARFVSTHAAWLAEHEAGPDAARELVDSAAKLARLARPERREYIVIGECPVTVASPEGESVPCGARVRAYTEKNIIRCPRCETEDTLEWWESRIVPNLVDLPLLTAGELLVYLHRETGVAYTETAIRQWAARGYIRRHGRDVRSRTLYDRAAVLAFAQDRTKESDGKAA